MTAEGWIETVEDWIPLGRIETAQGRVPYGQTETTDSIGPDRETAEGRILLDQIGTAEYRIVWGRIETAEGQFPYGQTETAQSRVPQARSIPYWDGRSETVHPGSSLERRECCLPDVLPLTHS